MQTLPIMVAVSRLGVAMVGSPYAVKLRYRRLHIEPLIAPLASKRPVQEILIFSNIEAPVMVGDIVTMPEGSVSKIIDVRSYPSSLQCMLQRQPFVSVPLWIPDDPRGRIGSDKSLADPSYVSAGTQMALLEPHGSDGQDSTPSAIGQLDRRGGWLYSMQPLLVRTVFAIAGDYWILTESSSIWTVSNDFRAPARRLPTAPTGVI